MSVSGVQGPLPCLTSVSISSCPATGVQGALTLAPGECWCYRYWLGLPITELFLHITESDFGSKPPGTWTELGHCVSLGLCPAPHFCEFCRTSSVVWRARWNVLLGQLFLDHLSILQSHYWRAQHPSGFSGSNDLLLCGSSF